MKEDPRGCDEGTWSTRLFSSLVAPVRDIVTGASSAVNLLAVAHPPTGLFVRDGPAALLQRHDGYSIGQREGIVAEGFVAERDRSSIVM